MLGSHPAGDTGALNGVLMSRKAVRSVSIRPVTRVALFVVVQVWQLLGGADTQQHRDTRRWYATGCGTGTC